ncbi:putative two-component sensor [Pseudomonas sp. ATCC 13867]|uniref:PAS domain S-box protein n=1 Tax=Pseudomonas sp. ATCC 13867 TaxID=1294143 RepID=UPI0002C4EDC8|nr:PAS domain S-box protein [Pseudomonas sp. ATCC 13867]AGI24548.1 putative two-component sensor [Pseudomonas sp. ATCC 13867]
MPHLNTLVRLVREQAPVAAQAEVLQRLCLERDGVARALYVEWQPRSHSFEAVAGASRLPPGSGDPLQANDLALAAHLEGRQRLPLDELMSVPCWLAGRLRRAGWGQGLALVLSLDAQRPGLLLVQSPADQAGSWLDWIGELLGEVLVLARHAHRTAPLLSADPQPALVLDESATLVDCNRALRQWLTEFAGAEPRDLLPSNHAQLLRTCLEQGRAVHEVVGEREDRQFLWTFVPMLAERQVLVHGREVTMQQREQREAATASRLYRQIIENTTDLISRRTLDGQLLDVSPASWTLLGYWPEELRGKALLPMLHEQDRQRVAERTRDALVQDGYVTLTYRLRHRDGHYLWFETASRAIRETYTGQVMEVVSVSRDITARVQAEEGLRRLAEVVEANTDLVLFVDPAGRVTYLNPSARRALGLEDEALPASVADVLDDGLADKLEGEGWDTARHSGVWSAEGRLRAGAGRSAAPLSLVLLAHQAAGGERYYSLVARDMTERELRENQQRRHQEELAHTARLVTLGELASGIAHEMNQPLAAVMNYASASQRYLKTLDSQPEAAHRVAQGLAQIVEHTAHASEVIRRLRAFLRKGQRRMQALDINEVARASLGLCAWEAAGAEVAVSEALTENLPPIYADRVLLEQVFLNLLRNAIEANRERHAGEPSHIRLGSHREEDGRLCVWVEDEGPGASGEALEQMFTPFFTSKPDGLGLGLSMSRGIVEGFGGTLDARAVATGGLRLACRLPAGGRGQ